jgi:hypothetical protein
MFYKSQGPRSSGRLPAVRSRVLQGRALWTSLFVMLWVDAAAAQRSPYEAKRHVDAQGIEVIQNRTAGADAKAAAPKSQGSKKEIEKNALAAATAASGGPHPTKVSPREQSERDLERVEILKQELQTEQLLYQRNVALLQAPNVKAMLSEHELQRLKYTLGLHERNVKSLKAEIGRAEGLSR